LVQGQTELCGELAEIVRIQDEENWARDFLDPSTAILSVLWPLFHSSGEPMTVGQLAKFVDTLLRSRGGTQEYSAGEIGTLLTTMSISRRRRNSGVYLTLDPDSNRQVHRLAAARGIGKAVSDCAYCQEAGIEPGPGAALEGNEDS